MLSSLFSVLRIFTKKIIYDVLALKNYLTRNPQILFCPPLYTPLCLSVKRRQTQSSFYPFQFGHLLFQLFLLILYHWCFCLTATLIRYIIVTGTLPVCLSIFIKLLIGLEKDITILSNATLSREIAPKKLPSWFFKVFSLVV